MKNCISISSFPALTSSFSSTLTLSLSVYSRWSKLLSPALHPTGFAMIHYPIKPFPRWSIRDHPRFENFNRNDRHTLSLLSVFIV